MAQLLQNIIMAVLIGTAYLQIGDDQASQVKRQPALFFVCVNQGVFGGLILINSCMCRSSTILVSSMFDKF